MKFKPLFFISYLTFSFALQAQICEKFTGLTISETLCWNDFLKGWLSQKCLSENCEAKKFFQQKTKMPPREIKDGGYNPSSQTCHLLKLSVIVLKDKNQSEYSFCRFKDNSLVDADAIHRFIK